MVKDQECLRSFATGRGAVVRGARHSNRGSNRGPLRDCKPHLAHAALFPQADKVCATGVRRSQCAANMPEGTSGGRRSEPAPDCEPNLAKARGPDITGARGQEPYRAAAGGLEAARAPGHTSRGRCRSMRRGPESNGQAARKRSERSKWCRGTFRLHAYWPLAKLELRSGLEVAIREPGKHHRLGDHLHSAGAANWRVQGEGHETRGQMGPAPQAVLCPAWQTAGAFYEMGSCEFGP